VSPVCSEFYTKSVLILARSESDSAPSGSTDDGPAEHRLLCRLADGDAHAFWELWVPRQPEIFMICYRRMGKRVEDAEDALSEVMQRARETLPREALRIRNLTAWLYRMATNVCIDLYRRDKRRHQGLWLTDGALLNSPDTQPSPEGCPAAIFLAAEVNGAVARIVRGLPQRLRGAAGLFFLDGASYQTISVALDISEPNARKRIQEARRILKQRLTDEFPGLWPLGSGSISASTGVVRKAELKPEATHGMQDRTLGRGNFGRMR
jgi:RNA polymerase sigma factor (sigma-70 family)